MRRVNKEETCTHKIQTLLENEDDFMTARQIMEKTKLNYNQVTATLSHFKKRKVAASIESNNKVYWYAIGEDTRTFTLEERQKEEKGNRCRKHSSGVERYPYKV